MDWVLNLVRVEIGELLKLKKYTGNIIFEVHIFKSGIANVNIATKKSVQKPQPIK